MGTTIKRKRIIHVLPLFELAQGGPSLAVLGMAIEQRKRGFRPWIATCSNETSDYTLIRLARKHHVPVVTFRYRWKIGEFAPSLPLFRWLWHATARTRLIHLHYVFTFTTTIGGLCAILRRTPFILRPAGQLGVAERQRGYYKKMIHYYLIERNLLRMAKAVHTTSTQEAHELSSLYRTAPVVVIPHGTPLPFEKALADSASDRRALQSNATRTDSHDDAVTGARRQPIHLVSISRLDQKKRILELLDQCQRVCHPLRISIAGDGSPTYRSEVARRAALHPYPVVLLGALSRREVWQLLSQASLFVSVSLSENFSLSLFEALSVGVPCVISAGHHYAADLAAHNAAIVVRDATTLGEELNKWLAEPSALEQVGQRGQAYCRKHFSWARVGELLEEVYS